MATIQLKLDTRYKAKDSSYNIVIRVLTKDKSRNIKTGIKVLKHQWKENKVVKHPHAEAINSILYNKLSEYQELLYQCIKEGKDIIVAIAENKKVASYNAWVNVIIERRKKIGKLVYIKKLKNLLRDIEECFDDNQSFHSMNMDWINKLHVYLRDKGNSQNTIFKKLNVIRQLFEQARREGKTSAPNHFYNYKVKTTPVKKEKLTIEEISLIAEARMTGLLNDVRNLFMFSYYCWGMRFTDCVNAKWSNIEDNKIIFPRIAKSNKDMVIDLHPRLKELINKYDHRRDQEYIFPFHEKKDSANAICNRYLKAIADLCGIQINLTFHIARHSFAYHMKLKDKSIEIIKDLLGHSSVQVTQMYLKSFDDERLNQEANVLYE